MNHDDTAFLSAVKFYVQKHPDIVQYLFLAVYEGIEAELKEHREQAADMEAALSYAVAKRMKRPLEFVHSKVKKWDGKTYLSWDWFFEEMEKSK